MIYMVCLKLNIDIESHIVKLHSILVHFTHVPKILNFLLFKIIRVFIQIIEDTCDRNIRYI